MLLSRMLRSWSGTKKREEKEGFSRKPIASAPNYYDEFLGRRFSKLPSEHRNHFFFSSNSWWCKAVLFCVDCSLWTIDVLMTSSPFLQSKSEWLTLSIHTTKLYQTWSCCQASKHKLYNSIKKMETLGDGNTLLCSPLSTVLTTWVVTLPKGQQQVSSIKVNFSWISNYVIIT